MLWVYTISIPLPSKWDSGRARDSWVQMICMLTGSPSFLFSQLPVPGFSFTSSGQNWVYLVLGPGFLLHFGPLPRLLTPRLVVIGLFFWNHCRLGSESLLRLGLTQAAWGGITLDFPAFRGTITTWACRRQGVPGLSASLLYTPSLGIWGVTEAISSTS